MWEVFKDWIFDIIQFFYSFCGDWGLAIIIVTVIFRILVAPLMYKQTKSTYQMQKIQPKIQSIQERFADDRVRQSEEMQKIYASTKFNPLAGCLPMLIQLPIFAALFQVLRELPVHISGYQTVDVAQAVQDPALLDQLLNGPVRFYDIIPSLELSPANAINVSFGTFVPYMILLLIFAGATFIPMVIQQLKTNNNAQRTQMIVMAVVMTAFMLWIGWGSPAGVLLFWGASSVIGILQSQLTLRHFKKKDEKEEALLAETAPVEVYVTRKAKKARPKKKR